MGAEVLTVKAMAQALGLCRDRFYDLVAQGVFPPPLRCQRTRRPYYSAELHEQCRQVRESGIGRNGRPIRFYQTQRRTARRGRSPQRVAEARAAAPHERLAAQLRALGVGHATGARVRQLLRAHYPRGVAKDDDVSVLRRLLRELWER